MKYAYFAIGPFYKTIALILLITVIDDIMNDKSNIFKHVKVKHVNL